MTEKSASARERTSAHSGDHIARPRRCDSGWRPISNPKLDIRGIWHLTRHHVDDGGLDTDAWIVAITAHRIEERLRTLDAPSLVREDYDRHTYREFAAMIGADRTTAGLAAGESRGGPMPAPE